MLLLGLCFYEKKPYPGCWGRLWHAERAGEELEILAGDAKDSAASSEAQVSQGSPLRWSTQRSTDIKKLQGRGLANVPSPLPFPWETIFQQHPIKNGQRSCSHRIPSFSATGRKRKRQLEQQQAIFPGCAFGQVFLEAAKLRLALYVGIYAAGLCAVRPSIHLAQSH